MSEITMPILLDSTGQEMVDALNLIAIAQAGGVDDEISFAGQARLVDMGLGQKAIPVGTIQTVNIETSMSVTVNGTGVTGAEIDEVTFLEEIGEAGSAIYEFTFDGAVWKLGDHTVNLAAYGITITGTPAEGDHIVVNENATSHEVVTIGHDYDTPVLSGIKHTMTMQTRNVIEMLQFDAPEALFYVDPTDYPDGLAAGTTYTITLNKAAYDNSTSQDGVIGFTPTQAVPAGGYVRHSTLGVYRSDSTYTRANLLAGKFITYNANFEQIEQLETKDAPTGTSLGTTTAETVDIKTAHMNYTRRNGHGCNRWDQSNLRQRLNSEGTGWFKKQNEWDFPPANVANIVGFLSKIDPALRKQIKKVKKIHALGTCDGGGFVETEDYVFVLSMTEVNLGKNNNVNETAYGVEGSTDPISTPYPYYVGAANADRIKTLTGTARTWWLRGPYPSLANGVRSVSTSGALISNFAGSTNGAAPAWVI